VAKAAQPKEVKVAIYTRKSVEEGLQQEFNSLHAQRDSCENYIRSQSHAGLVCLPQHYDDGGFSGGSLERPELKRLMADIRAGKVNCVAVYKLDRLSRSIRDFFRLMEVFEEFNVAFVSVTQSFDTNTSMGKLMLHILLSFAEFERQVVSERTRDKIRLSRQRGKWSGGTVVLGYDLDPESSKLVVSEDEAQRVRAIFRLYEEHHALGPVVVELHRRGWLTKSRETRKGQRRGGNAFTKSTLHLLLTNPVYVGKVRHKDECFPGEHPGIIDELLWNRVSKLLAAHGKHGEHKNKSGALLKGLLRCSACQCAMTPAHSQKNNKRYRYYACTKAQKLGWARCPSKSIPAAEVEQFVIERFRGIGSDPELVAEVVAQVERQREERQDELASEERLLLREIERWRGEVRNLVGQVKPGDRKSAAAIRLAELEERIDRETARLEEVQSELTDDTTVPEDEVRDCLAEFDALWESMSPIERSRLLHLLIEKVDYNGLSIEISFHSTGFSNLLNYISQTTTAKEVA
jgi:site-specific DNA recombinase